MPTSVGNHTTWRRILFKLPPDYIETWLFYSHRDCVDHSWWSQQSRVYSRQKPNYNSQCIISLAFWFSIVLIWTINYEGADDLVPSMIHALTHTVHTDVPILVSTMAQQSRITLHVQEPPQTDIHRYVLPLMWHVPYVYGKYGMTISCLR